MQCIAHQTATHYQLIGEKPMVLVMLHGWGHTHETFSYLIPGLADHFTLLLPDLPGFGESANPVPLANNKAWNSESYADWLVDLLQQTIPSREYILLGHSFGGKIAAISAVRNKHERCRGLILIDSSGLPLPLTAKEQLAQTVAQLLPSKLKQAVRHQSGRLLKIIGVATDYQNANSQQQAVLRQIVREDISSQITHITLPTTIIWGATDETTPLSAGKQFANLIPHSKLRIIADAGHCPFQDQPKTTLQAILTSIT